jgi:hypothetical protein
MDLGETGWGYLEWIQLAQNMSRWRAVVNAVMNLRVLAPRSELVINKQAMNTISVQYFIRYY